MKSIVVLCCVLFWCWFVFDCCKENEVRQAESTKQRIEEKVKLSNINQLKNRLNNMRRWLIISEKALAKYDREGNFRMYLYQLEKVERSKQDIKDVEKKIEKQKNKKKIKEEI